MTQPLDYNTTPQPPPRRTAATWALLLLVWTIGLAVWAAYITLVAVIFLRIFG